MDGVLNFRAADRNETTDGIVMEHVRTVSFRHQEQQQQQTNKTLIKKNRADRKKKIIKKDGDTRK